MCKLLISISNTNDFLVSNWKPASAWMENSTRFSGIGKQQFPECMNSPLLRTGHLGILLYQLLHRLLLVRRSKNTKFNHFSNLLSLEQHLLWAEVEKNKKGHLKEGTSWRPVEFNETSELILLALIYTYFKNDASSRLTTNGHIEKHFWSSHCCTCEATKCEKNTPQICSSVWNDRWQGRVRQHVWRNRGPGKPLGQPTEIQKSRVFIGPQDNACHSEEKQWKTVYLLVTGGYKGYIFDARNT